MGYYINRLANGELLPPTRKAVHLIDNGAIEIPQPSEFIDNLVCVVENGLFDAAAYIFSGQEMKEFYPSIRDTRKRRWLIVDNADVLSGYRKE